MHTGSKTNIKIAASGTDREKLRFVNLSHLSRLNFEFYLDVWRGLRPFQYKLDRRASPQTSVLTKQFFGFCLAVPTSQRECEHILSLVRESGVGAIRFDFCYDQDYELGEALLSGLRELEVEVLLHLVQPLEAARQFPHAAALADWQCFLETTSKRFEGLFGALEIGTTINRVKWAGYDLEGFIAMWEVAHAFCKTHKMTLVGPNVTDFEPQYNAGTLGLLARRKMLPDIHSNNLFAERSIEPEDADHKMLGYTFRFLHGFDLVKKMSLLTSIAKRYAIERNWSTCAFWTIPRIARLLPQPDEQMADYLVRYYILCASHGGFERIYWGPLVSYREGLVDDGTEDRSSSDHRDVVAFYSSYPGELDQWRKRPAFSAMAALTRQMADFQYVATRCSKAGLEIHEFKNGEATCLVAWTMNGGIARVRDCIHEASLQSLDTIYNRDGEFCRLCPDFITQSPIFLHWKDGEAPEVLGSARRLQQTVAARAPKGLDYFEYKTDRWWGILLASSKEEANQITDALRPEAIAACAEQASLRKSRNAIWTVEDPRNSVGSVVVKKPARIAWHKRILDRKKPSKALRSWNGTSELMRRGVETARVVAYFESTRKEDVFDNWFICEQVVGGRSVRDFFSRFAQGESPVEGYTLDTFSAQLIPFVLNMHAKGVFFRDLAGGNILIDSTREGILAFSLIDTARVRCERKGVSLSHRVEDLKRLTNKLSQEQQLDFMNRYLSKIGKRFTPAQRLSFQLYEVKTKLKRHKRRLLKKFR